LPDKLRIPDEVGPYDATLSIGRFPFDWELWDYAPVAGAWVKARLATGSNAARVRLPHAGKGDLVGHALMWAVTLVNLDERARTTEISVALIKDGKPSSELKLSFQAVPERPYLFVTVEASP
jgi:hypothetical protein